ncbi:glycine-rich protein family [Trichomonas vaginalis G3]|uniref:glycine-rich protein family n=1 Tax=Trichomonas vaginalis (strain ATCC PRA-98 / G3) TaxID=412133 RepID=UPI0021E54167|nr:glycine-rich protein family [Trichomonas vaginalis G3]KAI5532845.1 glycine-rich protein family [Trichomonas vaginalis G3]
MRAVEGGSGYSATSIYAYHNTGGSGGGDKGGDGTLNPSYLEYAAYGGTQTGPGTEVSHDNRKAASFGFGGSGHCSGCSLSNSGGGAGWYGGAAAGDDGFSAAGGSGYVFSINSFVPDGYNYKREYFLRKPSMKSGVKYGDGAIRITLLDYAEVENIKIQGCGSQGITFAQIASFITLPTVS